jgi:hypothetical protein
VGCLKTLSVSKVLERRSIIVAGLSVADGPVIAIDDITDSRFKGKAIDAKAIKVCGVVLAYLFVIVSFFTRWW